MHHRSSLQSSILWCCQRYYSHPQEIYWAGYRLRSNQTQRQGKDCHGLSANGEKDIDVWGWSQWLRGSQASRYRAISFPSGGFNLSSVYIASDKHKVYGVADKVVPGGTGYKLFSFQHYGYILFDPAVNYDYIGAILRVSSWLPICLLGPSSELFNDRLRGIYSHSR